MARAAGDARLAGLAGLATELAQLAYKTERSNMDRRQALVAGLAKLRDVHDAS